MGAVFKKTFSKPLPHQAEVVTTRGTLMARWRAARGKTRTAMMTTGKDGSLRIRVASGTLIAKYRDGNGHIVEAPTGCRTESAARQVLNLQFGVQAAGPKPS
jgi:hypothetical protein